MVKQQKGQKVTGMIGAISPQYRWSLIVNIKLDLEIDEGLIVKHLTAIDV